MSKSIFLLGDVVRHVYLKPVEDKNAHFEKKGKYKVYTQAMKSSDNRMECPPIIKQIIVKAINDQNLIIKPDYKFTYASDKPELSLFRILKKFPKTSEKTDGKKVFRADPSSEYFGSELILIPPSGSDKSEKFAIMQELFNKINDDDQPNLLVLCDRNSELRDFIKTETGAQTKLKTLLGNTQQAIVVGIKECIKDDTWLSILAKLTEGHQEKCIVILSVDDLRNAGLSITEHGTIEQNIREIVGYLDEEPLNKIWRKICQHLVFIFRENLVLCLNADSSNDIYPGNGTYHYCPYFDRPAQIRPGLYGKMPGKFTIMVASIVKHLCESVCGLEKSINIAVRLGILAYVNISSMGIAIVIIPLLMQ